MSVETHVHRASQRVRAERRSIGEKIEAFATFIDSLGEISTEGSATAGKGMVPAAGAQLHGTRPTDDGCRAVREAFAETVRPHCIEGADDPEPLLETVRSELTDSIALALAPTTETGVTDELLAGIRTAADARRTETMTLQRALEREANTLATAEETVDEITGWIADVDERPLSELGFEDLRERYRRLSTDRDRCDRLLRDRQQFLAGTTSTDGEAGIRHRDLIAHCYEPLPVDYPVLSTVAGLARTCETCQRAVRTHLVRRA